MFNNQISAAPAVINDSAPALAIDDGHAGEIHDVDGGVAEAPVVDIGNAEAEGGEDAPLGLDGRRDLKTEAVSLEHMLTHTPFNAHCPSCLRGKMLRKPASRADHDPATALK